MRQPGWEGSLGRMDTCIRMAESFCCPPEIITILLIGYAPKGNKKLKKKTQTDCLWALPIQRLICDQNFGLKRNTPNNTDLKLLLQQPFSLVSCSAKEKGATLKKSEGFSLWISEQQKQNCSENKHWRIHLRIFWAETILKKRDSSQHKWIFQGVEKKNTFVFLLLYFSIGVLTVN